MEKKSKKVKKVNMLSSSELAAFCFQLAMIIKSGISASDGIEIMAADVTGEGKPVLQKIQRDLEEGSRLCNALAGQKIFPEYLITMVEIGEASGKLDNVLDSLAEHYEREDNLAKMLKSAVAYPLILISMMLAVIIVLVVQVMPIFNDVFLGLGVPMEGFSLAVLNVGLFLGMYGWFILTAFVLMILGFWLFTLTESGKKFAENFKTRSIFTRKIYQKIATGHFASAMQITLSSGMNVDQSLIMAEKLIKFPIIQRKIKLCQKHIEEGQSFSKALTEADIFSSVYTGMINIAYKAGAVDTAMGKVASLYREETDRKIINIISMIEPSLVAVLSVIVGLILLSVMLPLMSFMAYV